MPGHNPRKVKKLLKKIFKGKSADKGLKDLSDENYQPGKTPPNRTPQTDVMGRKTPTAKSGEPLKQEAKKGTPAMADSKGKPMTPGEQRRAIRRVRKAEKKAEKAQKKAEKAKEKAKRKAEREKIRASRPNRTPQTGVMGRRLNSKTSAPPLHEPATGKKDKEKVDPSNLGIPPVPKGFDPSKKLPRSTPRSNK